MLHRSGEEMSRDSKTITLEADLVIVGGGLAGTCAAITAARQGLKVVLVHDRPVLGGNASSEVRLWILGATAHMGSNNRFSRESGVVGEIMVENLYRNPEGNPLIFDTILLEYVTNEPNIRLLLNTSAFEVAKHPEDADRIAYVRAFCSQNSTMYVLKARLFCDSSGDGIVGFLAGAAFRMGAETKEEFGEMNAPSGDFGYLLGHSMYFYTKDTGRPVTFVAPAFALKNVPERIPRYQQFNTKEQGCKLWWIEYGGRLDTVHDTEEIKWELWRVIYGVWDYIKNSGKFPEAATLTLEWVGHVPGKRESRRFEGDYMLQQKDIIEQRRHDDAVAFGGWSIDLHPADGVYSPLSGARHLRAKGPYQIPYRCYYSRNVKNLFLAGRIISASHVAFGSTRVMATCAVGAQAVAVAAGLCKRFNCMPRELNQPDRISLLQRKLFRIGHDIKELPISDPLDLATKATLTASSSLTLQVLPPDGPLMSLKYPIAQMLPLPEGPVPEIILTLDASTATELVAELRTSSRLDHHSPDVTLGKVAVALPTGQSLAVTLRFDAALGRARYAFLCLVKNESISVRCSEARPTGILTLQHRYDHSGSEYGGEDYEIWRAIRRPEAHNFALGLSRGVNVFGPGNLIHGTMRPNHLPNAWVADFGDAAPAVRLNWPTAQTIARIDLAFDVDYDHALESVLMGQPERVLPFCVKRYRIIDAGGEVLHECKENHHALNTVILQSPVRTQSLQIQILEMNGPCPAAMFWHPMLCDEGPRLMVDPRLRDFSGGLVHIRAPAKLNLGLRVFPARADGFHDIETWMVATSWHDTVTFVPTGGKLELVITGRAEGIPTELDKNLVGKAAMRLAEAAGTEATGRIELHKVLPPGGGLGGGSSDAANVLVALNHAWGLQWKDEKLEAIAGELGSDVPFFVRVRASLCTGRGEIMTPLPPRHLLFAVLIIPPRGCPTKEVYLAFDAGHHEGTAAKTDWRKLALAGAKELNGMLINDLARGAFHVAPWLEELRDRAAAGAGQQVHVTGSGSTLFTLAGSSVEADEIAERLKATLPEDHGVVTLRIMG